MVSERPRLRMRCLFLLMLGGLWGCSAPPAAQISKLVVLSKGVPVQGAEVLLEPEPAGKGSAFGTTGTDGSCKLDLGGRKGLTPGKYKISINRFELPDGNVVPSGEQGAVLKQNGSASQKIYLFRRPLNVGDNTLQLELDQADEQQSPPSVP